MRLTAARLPHRPLHRIASNTSGPDCDSNDSPKTALKTNAITIKWDDCWQKQWHTHLAAATRSPLEQSWGYAEAVRARFGVTVRRAVIYQGRAPIAVAQVLQKVGLSQLLRGPVLLQDDVSDETIVEIYHAIRARFGWRKDGFLNWIPELTSSPKNKKIIKKSRLWRIQNGYTSAWIDLQQPLSALRSGLAGNWRNQLNKATRATEDKEGKTTELLITKAKNAQQLAWLLQEYESFRKAHKFSGPSGKLVEHMYKQFSLQQNALPLIATHQGQPVAGVLLLKHGNSATYYMGVTTDKGRKLYAHNALLWDGLRRLQEQGCTWLDVGGLDDKKMPGVSRFKRGLYTNGLTGGEFTLCGMYF